LTDPTHSGRVGDSREAAPEVDMGYDKLSDTLDEWVEDIRKGT
jgi:hypothetical protein